MFLEPNIHNTENKYDLPGTNAPARNGSSFLLIFFQYGQTVWAWYIQPARAGQLLVHDFHSIRPVVRHLGGSAGASAAGALFLIVLPVAGGESTLVIAASDAAVTVPWPFIPTTPPT